MSTHIRREALAFAILLALLAPTAAGYGETVFNSNTIISGSGFDVQTNRRVGQSFTPSEAFILYNVTLHVENVGVTQIDLLNVTIVTDAAGSPSTTILAGSERVRSGLGWLDFPLTPQPTLAAGTTYWIVAASLSAPNEGYRWYHSNANVVAGESKIETGGPWGAPQVPDMVYITYGIKLEPSIRVGLSIDRVSANPGDTFTYTVYLNNTGSRAAPNVWVNLSLPADVTYVNDNAGPALGGVRTGNYNWSFTNIANGPHSYRVNARVDDFVPPGSLLTATVYLDYKESTGVSGPRSTATASIIAGLNPKPLYLAYDGTADQRDWLRPAPPGGAIQDFDGDGNPGLTVDKDSIPSTAPRWTLDPGFARPFRLRGNVTVFLYLDSMTPSDVASVTFTLYDGGTTTIVSRTVSVTFNAFSDWQPFSWNIGWVDYWMAEGARLEFRISMGISGDDVYVAYNGPTAPSRLVVTTETYIRIDAIALKDANGPAALFSTRDTVFIEANVSDPLGAGEISGVTIDMTDPDGVAVVANAPLALVTTDPGAVPAWKVFRYSYPNPSKEGTYTFALTATEGNGVQSSRPGSFLVRIPILSPVATAIPSFARPGDVVRFQIDFDNSGQGSATAWFNVTIPSGLTYISDTASADGGLRTGPTNWTFSSVGPGNHRFDIDVRVNRDVPAGVLTARITLAYADEKGFLWSVPPRDVAVTIGGPYLLAQLGLDKTGTRRSETLGITVWFNNTGDEASSAVWINVTLPSSLVYWTDNANGLAEFTSKDTSGPVLRYTFANVGVGAHGFAVWANGSTTLRPGDSIPIAVEAAYRVSGGLGVARSTASITAVGIGPVILAAVAGPTVGDPGDLLSLTLYYNNTGTEAATGVWVNFTLDPAMSYVSASPAPTSAGSVVSWTFPAASLGLHSIALTVRLATGVGDGTVHRALLAVAYADVQGTVYGSPPDAHDVLVVAPVFSLGVSSSASQVEGGDLLTLTIAFPNMGGGTASDAWINVTLSDALVFLNDDAPVAETIAAGVRSWRFQNLPPGSHTFRINATVPLTTPHGTALVTSVSLEATDANGNQYATVLRSVAQSVITAHVTVSIEPLVAVVLPGGTFAYRAWVNNTGGRTAATVWINDSFAGPLTFLGDTSGLPRTARGGSVTWTLMNFVPDGSITFDVTVRLSGGKPGDVIPNGVEVEFTNAKDQRIGFHRSPEVTVAVIPPPAGLLADPFFLLFLLALAVAGPAVGYGVWWSRRPRIEEVFLLHSSGILLYHRSRHMNAQGDKDKDLLATMLSVVRDFVRESFQYGEDRDVQKIEFGQYNILIEPGKHVHLAAVFSGADRGSLRRRLQKVVHEIEEKFGTVLDGWDGTMETIVGVKDLVQKVLRP